MRVVLPLKQVTTNDRYLASRGLSAFWFDFRMAADNILQVIFDFQRRKFWILLLENGDFPSWWGRRSRRNELAQPVQPANTQHLTPPPAGKNIQTCGMKTVRGPNNFHAPTASHTN